MEDIFKIDIVNIDDNLEALAARSSLEYFGYNVSLHFIPKSKVLVELLNGSKHLSKNILIMCHGIDEGIVLPELAKEVAKEQPYNKILTPNNLNDFLKLNNSLVVNTGCSTGTKDFADAFLENGSDCYVAPRDFPSFPA